MPQEPEIVDNDSVSGDLDPDINTEETLFPHPHLIGTVHGRIDNPASVVILKALDTALNQRGIVPTAKIQIFNSVEQYIRTCCGEVDQARIVLLVDDRTLVRKVSTTKRDVYEEREWVTNTLRTIRVNPAKILSHLKDYADTNIRRTVDLIISRYLHGGYLTMQGDHGPRTPAPPYRRPGRMIGY